MKLLENVYWKIKTGGYMHFELETDILNKDYAKGKIRALTKEEQVEYFYNLCCKPDSKAGDLAELGNFVGESNQGSTRFLMLVLYGSWGIDQEIKKIILQALNQQEG